jgi:diaminopimelate epimerase
MKCNFNKYQGTGNDFIIIDNRAAKFNPEDQKLVSRLCDRRFGIGADGLILITNNLSEDYEMKYFNSDGKLGTMCGNGGRCAADFSYKWGIAGKEQRFIASDGIHEAVVENELVRLSMNDVTETRIVNGNYFINTGSPHYVLFVKDVRNLDVFTEGKKLRLAKDFAPGGTNVNFVEAGKEHIFVRTFERGVEDETLSCGTGVTASAIAAALTGHFDSNTIPIKTIGGDLTVSFDILNEKIRNIWLSGPATFVFEGEIEL